jgi:hypothetical protein
MRSRASCSREEERTKPRWAGCWAGLQVFFFFETKCEQRLGNIKIAVTTSVWTNYLAYVWNSDEKIYLPVYVGVWSLKHIKYNHLWFVKYCISVISFEDCNLSCSDLILHKFQDKTGCDGCEKPHWLHLDDDPHEGSRGRRNTETKCKHKVHLLEKCAK